MNQMQHVPSSGPNKMTAGGFDHAAADATPEEPLTLLTFCLGGQNFALSVIPVREILDEQPVATMPEAAGDVVGLIDVRGESVLVMDVSHRLGVVSSLQHGRRIVVLERPGTNGRPVGVLADQVLSVVEIPPDGVETPPEGAATGTGATLLRGVVRLNKQLFMLLDHQRLLGTPSDDLFEFGT